ncbi:MAG: helix-turn-helix transcriptional regulator, partial [Clostridia bacterium]|nr:helix-turn-helix transcriptional regulator [Clostridia bacterium]
GVEEFVVPIIKDGNLICNVSVSGYRGKLQKSRDFAEKMQKKTGKYFAYLYSQLKTEVPEETYVLQAVKPLVYMFSQLQNECIRTSDIVNTSSELYRKALRYIYDNYMNSFTIEEMAKTLNYSESYLRHIFVKQSGKSIAKTVLAIRLSQASTLLVSTNLSVTTIALECGFCDGNYFSTVFKKKYGVSPMKYRQGNL